MCVEVLLEDRAREGEVRAKETSVTLTRLSSIPTNNNACKICELADEKLRYEYECALHVEENTLNAN